MGDRIAEPWGERTPYGRGEAWPVRVDSELAVPEGAIRPAGVSDFSFISDDTTVDALIARVRERIGRIRGPGRELAVGWAPPRGQTVGRARDELLRRITYTAIGIAVTGIVLFAIFAIVLRGHTPSASAGARAASSVVVGEAVA